MLLLYFCPLLLWLPTCRNNKGLSYLILIQCGYPTVLNTTLSTVTHFSTLTNFIPAAHNRSYLFLLRVFMNTHKIRAWVIFLPCFVAYFCLYASSSSASSILISCPYSVSFLLLTFHPLLLSRLTSGFTVHFNEKARSDGETGTWSTGNKSKTGFLCLNIAKQQENVDIELKLAADV